MNWRQSLYHIRSHLVHQVYKPTMFKDSKNERSSKDNKLCVTFLLSYIEFFWSVCEVLHLGLYHWPWPKPPRSDNLQILIQPYWTCPSAYLSLLRMSLVTLRYNILLSFNFDFYFVKWRIQWSIQWSTHPIAPCVLGPKQGQSHKLTGCFPTVSSDYDCQPKYSVFSATMMMQWFPECFDACIF